MTVVPFLNPAKHHLMRAYTVFRNIWELFPIWCVDIISDIFSFAITRMSVADTIWSAKTFAILNTKIQYDQRNGDTTFKIFIEKMKIINYFNIPTKVFSQLSFKTKSNLLYSDPILFTVFFYKQKTEEDIGHSLFFQLQGTFVTKFRQGHLVCPIVQYELLCSPDWFYLSLTVLLCFVPFHSLCLFPRPHCSAPVFY